jgi:hypothetical protein
MLPGMVNITVNRFSPAPYRSILLKSLTQTLHRSRAEVAAVRSNFF